VTLLWNHCHHWHGGRRGGEESDQTSDYRVDFKFCNTLPGCTLENGIALMRACFFCIEWRFNTGVTSVLWALGGSFHTTFIPNFGLIICINKMSDQFFVYSEKTSHENCVLRLAIFSLYLGSLFIFFSKLVNHPIIHISWENHILTTWYNVYAINGQRLTYIVNTIANSTADIQYITLIYNTPEVA